MIVVPTEATSPPIDECTMGLPFVETGNFLQATRDTGYRSVAAAIAELIDNALQATATEICLFVFEETLGGSRGMVIAVLDNGCGMDAATLHRAMQFGGTDRFGDRRGLGRYGMGLPNSSLSQSRRFDVFSWRPNIGCVSSYIDLDEISGGLLQAVPSPRPSIIPSWIKNDLPVTGTLVVWSRCDRLANRRASTVLVKLRTSLGRMYRRFLWKNVRILVNGELVKPIDPLFCHPETAIGGAKTHGDPLTYEIGGVSDTHSAKINIRFTLLPVRRWNTFPVEKKRNLGIVGGGGVSILRELREIDYGWHLMGAKRRENYDDWWRCEILFPSALDELFGVTHSKQGVNPTGELRTILSKDLEEIARELNARVRRSFTKTRLNAPSRAVQIADKKDRMLPTLGRSVRVRSGDSLNYRFKTVALPSHKFFDYKCRSGLVTVRINRDHPFFAQFYAKSLDDKVSRARFAFEALLISASRAALFAKNDDKRSLDHFIDEWSDVLASFIDR